MDVRNLSSHEAIQAHLWHCQADFRELIRIRNLENALIRTNGWNPMNLTVQDFLRPPPPPPAQAPAQRSRTSRPRGRNQNSRHPRNVGRNGQWRSQIYEEMVRIGRSLQGTYQHLEQGKIARVERNMQNPPDDHYRE